MGAIVVYAQEGGLGRLKRLQLRPTRADLGAHDSQLVACGEGPVISHRLVCKHCCSHAKPQWQKGVELPVLQSATLLCC